METAIVVVRAPIAALVAPVERAEVCVAAIAGRLCPQNASVRAEC
jgi:hypothetical protein